jgi:hypothetical protein
MRCTQVPWYHPEPCLRTHECSKLAPSIFSVQLKIQHTELHPSTTRDEAQIFSNVFRVPDCQSGEPARLALRPDRMWAAADLSAVSCAVLPVSTGSRALDPPTSPLLRHRSSSCGPPQAGLLHEARVDAGLRRGATHVYGPAAPWYSGCAGSALVMDLITRTSPVSFLRPAGHPRLAL